MNRNNVRTKEYVRQERRTCVWIETPEDLQAILQFSSTDVMNINSRGTLLEISREGAFRPDDAVFIVTPAAFRSPAS